MTHQTSVGATGRSLLGWRTCIPVVRNRLATPRVVKAGVAEFHAKGIDALVHAVFSASIKPCHQRRQRAAELFEDRFDKLVQEIIQAQGGRVVRLVLSDVHVGPASCPST